MYRYMPLPEILKRLDIQRNIIYHQCHGRVNRYSPHLVTFWQEIYPEMLQKWLISRELTENYVNTDFYSHVKVDWVPCGTINAPSYMFSLVEYNPVVSHAE